MRQWFTAAELAQMKLPGLPHSEFRLRERAKHEGWEARPREGVGGGLEYHISSLPPKAWAEVVRLEMGDVAEVALMSAILKKRARQAHEVAAPGQASFPDQQGMARLVLIHQVLERVRCGDTVRNACREICTLYNKRQLDIDPAVRAILGQRIAAETLRHWYKCYLRYGETGLVHDRRGRCNLIEQDSEVRALIVALVMDHPHANARHVYHALRARFQDRPLPSIRTIQRFMQQLRASPAVEHAANPDRWRSRRMVAFGSASDSVERLNQRWEIDSTRADLILADGCRHMIIGVLDVWSRRLMLHVSRTSSSAAVASLVRRAILAWGVPEEVVTDNGQEYTSRFLSSVFQALKIQQRLCKPFAPWQKPHIERAFRTFAHDLVELMPGYVGHNVAEREALRARQSFADRLMRRGERVELNLTPEQLQAFCDAWCTHVYQHQVHQGIGCSPYQRLAAWRGPVRRIRDERALDVLLQPIAGGDGIRRVHKQGVRVDGAWYIHADLAPYVGQNVQVRYDESDVGRLFVFDETGRFICVALRADGISGISRAELAAAARKRQRQALAKERALLRELRRGVRTDDLACEILAARQAETEPLRLLPKPQEWHETDALREAVRAAQAYAHKPEAVPLTPEQEEALRRWRKEQEQARDLDRALELELQRRAQRMLEEERRAREQYYTDPHERYEALLARRRRGLSLTEEEEAFIRQHEAFLRGEGTYG